MSHHTVIVTATSSGAQIATRPTDGHPAIPWVTDEYGPVLAQTLLNYTLPIEYPASVFVELFTERLGTSSVTLGHRILAADGTLHCDGHAVVVWIDRRSGKSRPLPEGVRRAHEAMMATPAD